MQGQNIKKKNDQTRGEWHHNNFTPSLYLVLFCQLVLCPEEGCEAVECTSSAESVWYVGVSVIATKHGGYG